MKKNIWIQHNSAWIEKEKARGQDLDKNEKRKTRKKAESKQGKDVFESIKNTKLGENVNDDKLKRLLGSSPAEPKKANSLNLEKMFDPFAFSWRPSPSNIS